MDLIGYPLGSVVSCTREQIGIQPIAELRHALPAARSPGRGSERLAASLFLYVDNPAYIKCKQFALYSEVAKRLY